MQDWVSNNMNIYVSVLLATGQLKHVVDLKYKTKLVIKNFKKKMHFYSLINNKHTLLEYILLNTL